MSAKLPGFVTGANAKIIVTDGSSQMTLAYATDVSYSVDTLTVPVEVMGRYEVLSNEPIAFGCNGGFTVVRYIKDVAKDAGIDDAASSGNSIKKITPFAGHMDPAKMLISKTFDMIIYQKTTNPGDSASTSTGVFKIKDCRIVRRGGTISKRGVLMDSYQFVGILAQDEDDAGNAVGTSGDTDLS